MLVHHVANCIFHMCAFLLKALQSGPSKAYLITGFVNFLLLWFSVYSGFQLSQQESLLTKQSGHANKTPGKVDAVRIKELLLISLSQGEGGQSIDTQLRSLSFRSF